MPGNNLTKYIKHTHMKKSILLAALIITVFIFSNCHSAKKAMAAPKITYTNNLQTLVMDNCSPCHIPAKGGDKEAFDNYASIKGHIDDMITRIELHPGDKGFMPFKKERLSDSTIAIFRQWRKDGMIK